MAEWLAVIDAELLGGEDKLRRKEKGGGFRGEGLVMYMNGTGRCMDRRMEDGSGACSSDLAQERVWCYWSGDDMGWDGIVCTCGR